MFDTLVGDAPGWVIPDEVPDWLDEELPWYGEDPAARALAVEWAAEPSTLDADHAAAQALAVAPGAESARLIESIEVSRLSESGRVGFAVACERLTAWAAARQLPAIVEHVGREQELDVRGNERAFLDQACWFTEMQVALNVSETALWSRLAMARSVTGRLLDTYREFLAGNLSYLHVRAVVETLSDVGDDHAALAQHRILERAPGKTVGELRRFARNTVDRIDAEAAVRRHARTAEERTVARWNEPDGAAALQVRGPAHDVEAVWAALTLLAGPRESDDPRTIGSRRFDALLGLCLGAVAPRDDAEASVRTTSAKTPVQAHVVVDLATILGLADNPCELRGYGAIPAEVARGWLHQAETWRRLVTDPVTGHLLDYGPVVRFAPHTLRQFVAARDHRCTFPRCRLPAQRCDVDHDPPWRPDGAGGRTSAEHTASLCRRHHRLRTHGQWRILRRSNGATEWRSPSGRLFTTVAPPVLDDE